MAKFQRIQDLREDSDLRQEDVAEVLGITRQQYQLYESGKREIKFSLAIKLAQYYNVSLDYIAGISGTKSLRRDGSEGNDKSRSRNRAKAEQRSNLKEK